LAQISSLIFLETINFFSKENSKYSLYASLRQSPCNCINYKDMRKAIPAHKTSPAFCILKEGKFMPIIYKQFQNKLRSLIEKTGRKPKYYSSHSFRRGGASLAFESNVTTELIQLHGDWRSDAYKEYLEFSLEKKLMIR
jgi:hypothetical protein